MIVWESSVSDGGDVFAQELDFTGAFLGGACAVPDPAGLQVRPTVAGHSTFVVAWDDDTAGADGTGGAWGRSLNSGPGCGCP